MRKFSRSDLPRDHLSRNYWLASEGEIRPGDSQLKKFCGFYMQAKVGINARREQNGLLGGCLKFFREHRKIGLYSAKKRCPGQSRKKRNDRNSGFQRQYPILIRHISEFISQTLILIIVLNNSQYWSDNVSTKSLVIMQRAATLKCRKMWASLWPLDSAPTAMW